MLGEEGLCTAYRNSNQNFRDVTRLGIEVRDSVAATVHQMVT